MAIVKTFNYDNTQWEYIITYKQQKHMYLKVRNDKILVSVPFFMQEKLVEDFIIKSLPKITKNKVVKERNLVINGQDDYVYFLNEKYPIFIKYHSQKTAINFDYPQLVIFTKLQDWKQIQIKIEIFLRKEALAIFMSRLQYWSQIMGIDFNTLKIRSMVSKWGICQPIAKIITLNYKLIHYSYDIIDYVIIHELAHIVHGHHQKSFWNYVMQFCPKYQDCQKFLKQNRGC
ncbi:SprT family zinc-dependent metalloprotease [Spiroplasma endosymbiont of Nebria brevicollis]|uniref:M48 family metallopeptidase n=1 Tax=Spiroplasma endosymbiont of Nebria brevicollis TaxID=3066284 RepID=UPI00313F37AB